MNVSPTSFPHSYWKSPFSTMISAWTIPASLCYITISLQFRRIKTHRNNYTHTKIVLITFPVFRADSDVFQYSTFLDKPEQGVVFL